MATIRKKGKRWQVAILKKDGFSPFYKSGFYTKQEVSFPELWDCATIICRIGLCESSRG
jgi:hypothetical protein